MKNDRNQRCDEMMLKWQKCVKNVDALHKQFHPRTRIVFYQMYPSTHLSIGVWWLNIIRDSPTLVFGGKLYRTSLRIALRHLSPLELTSFSSSFLAEKIFLIKFNNPLQFSVCIKYNIKFSCTNLNHGTNFSKNGTFS